MSPTNLAQAHEKRADTPLGNVAHDKSLGNFLALVPRGLEDTIMALVRTKARDAKLTVLGGQTGQTSEEIGDKALCALVQHQELKGKANSPWFRKPVGTVEMEKQHFSVGYTDQNLCTWSLPGALEGSVWLRIETTHYDEIASLRCLGPLLALVTCTENMPTLRDPSHTLESLLEELKSWLASNHKHYPNLLGSAISLWQEYAQLSWKERLNTEVYASFLDRVKSNRVRFRMSCIRDHVDATYARTEFLKSFMERFESTVLPYQDDDSGWAVDLKQFDMEFVVIMLTNGCFALGISLLPYPFFNAKSFYTGNVPPDISKPYIGHENLEGLVRLRPTTAHVLLRMAQIKPFEIVLDPCAGLGTIPVEADIFFPKCIGLGGDIVLNHQSLASAASAMEQAARASAAPASMLAAWDAAMLPIRTASIDATVSDLPFGKQCLSSNGLKKLLPLVFIECARVLLPTKGRLVVLCGNPSITEYLEHSKVYWKLPCTIATPVSIGGLQAWIFRLERNEVRFDSNQPPKTLERIRALARRRDRILKHQASSKKSQQPTKKKHRIQA